MLTDIFGNPGKLRAGTPPKIEVDGSDDFSDFNWVFLRFQPLIFWHVDILVGKIIVFQFFLS